MRVVIMDEPNCGIMRPILKDVVDVEGIDREEERAGTEGREKETA